MCSNHVAYGSRYRDVCGSGYSVALLCNSTYWHTSRGLGGSFCCSAAVSTTLVSHSSPFSQSRTCFFFLFSPSPLPLPSNPAFCGWLLVALLFGILYFCSLQSLFRPSLDVAFVQGSIVMGGRVSHVAVSPMLRCKRGYGARY